MATGDSNALETHVKPPWEVAPLGTLGKHIRYAAIPALGAAFVFSMIFAILGLAFIVDEENGVPDGIIVGAIGLAGMISSAWCLGLIWWRLSLRAILAKRSLKRFPFQFLPACSFRNFKGPASVDWSPGGMTLTGFLDPDMLPSMALMTIAILVLQSGTAKLIGWKGTLVYLAFAIIISAILRSRRGIDTVTIRAQDIAAVRCNGPVVTIRFSRSPITRLKAIRLFIAPAAAREFFREFQENFPGLLPESYRAALDQPPVR
jgi:hypothetical protein